MKTDSNITPLDDLAYSLYCQHNKILVTIAHKSYFIEHKDIFKEYYIKANIQFRKEKLIKLNAAR